MSSTCCFCLRDAPDRKKRQSLLSQTRSAQESKQALIDYITQVSPSTSAELILSRAPHSYLCTDCGVLLNSWNKLRVQLPAVLQNLANRFVNPAIAASGSHMAEQPQSPCTPRRPAWSLGPRHLRTRRQMQTLQSASRRSQRSPAVHVR